MTITTTKNNNNNNNDNNNNNWNREISEDESNQSRLQH